MTTATQSAAQYVAQYESLAPRLPGSHLPWMTALRSKALARFSSSGFPSPREEEWKYTNVAPIERTRFTVGGVTAGTVDPACLARWRLPDAVCMVFVDGRFDAALSALTGLPDGTIIRPLSEALEHAPERVRPLLGRCTEPDAQGFIAFNTALFSDGALIVLPERTAQNRPIQLLHIATQPEALSTVRHLIVAESGAEGTVVETYGGPAGLSYLTVAVCEVAVGENAQLDLYKVQDEADAAFHFGGVYAKQSDYGRLRHHNFSLGGLLVRNEVHAALNLASECVMNGLFLASDRQHVDNHTRVNHIKPYGVSREMYKGILDNRARGVFQGRMIVHQDAQKTDSDMSNRNLLLSDGAEMDTKPQLEIYADDVKCAHGVTVGQLQEESVFYLRSRGVDETTARSMLTFAFANEMVKKVSCEPIRARILPQLLSRLPQIDINQEWL